MEKTIIEQQLEQEYNMYQEKSILDIHTEAQRKLNYMLSHLPDFLTKEKCTELCVYGRTEIKYDAEINK